ncbi:hypothetical protein QR680_007703 [Steinernema hermaphroditum]|uniref:Homeobox domain-containing protein n=1 Tax=Steinernema hermaphroditum TaxID=289476 RepID=A0AA39M6D7_9BILA|nr:hypothetical protein QR680_007703 [Steinernema hermaphroditum]
MTPTGRSTDFEKMTKNSSLVRKPWMKKCLFTVRFPDEGDSWKVAQNFAQKTTIAAAIRCILEPELGTVWVDVNRFDTGSNRLVWLSEMKVCTEYCVNGERYELRCWKERPAIRGWWSLVKFSTAESTTETYISDADDQKASTRSLGYSLRPEDPNYDADRHNYLLKTFDVIATPSPEVIEDIAGRLKMSTHRVRKWFTNRKAHMTSKELRKNKEAFC